ncbi:neogenin-like [Strongylocentrotus purpuratus]|uniref:Fibronectin type-III domain-containing protein n=1 Tax=Strongylocentrotus purpuratus TaxID=7668 RepID=A0A7M7PNA7_STRPU|nr:neogenin-like [Strongylocentrotus purpuratus]
MTTDGEFTQPELPSAPVVSGATNDSITLMWDAWDASTDIGDPPLTGYRVYYMLNNSREEEQEVRRYDRLAPSETVTGLSPYTAYMFCVSAFRPGVGGSGSRMEVEGTTQCSPPSRGPSSVYVTKGTRPGEILVSWENPPSNAFNCVSGVGGIRIYFTRYDIQSGISKRAADPIENSIDIPFDTSTTEHTLTLEPYSQYLIQVVVYNKDSETPRGEGFTQITEEMLAPAPTVSVEATSETVTVRWDAASPAHLNGDVQGYQLRYTQTKPEPLDPVIVDVMGNKYEITDGVTGDSEFEIEVRVLNGAGYGKWSPLMTSPLTGKKKKLLIQNVKWSERVSW